MLLRSSLILTFFPVCLHAGASPAGVTFYKDVLPVLERRCQNCHRPGEVAPMSFLTYKEARPWASAMREAVLTKKMPPWFADPHYGKFQNDRSLPKNEIDTLVAWAETGAREGDPKLAPQTVAFVEGWGIGKPDLVWETQPFEIPASGTIEYQYVVIPTGFTEDRWVQSAEVRPGNRSVTHHIITFVREPGSKWMADAKPGVPFVPLKQRKGGNAEGSIPAGELLVGYAPGITPVALNPGQAKLVKAGSDFVLQMHYTANGKPATDRSRVGVIFAKEKPAQRIFTSAAMETKFVIPPGEPNQRVDSALTIQEDTWLVDMMPHMHLRGKDFEYRLVFPTGEKQTILSVPRFDFNWQLFYTLEKPMLLPKGTRIECTAHFDNSPNNPGNPDSKAEVRWGDQSWEEMMIGWFDIAIDPDKNPLDYLRKKKPVTSD